MSQPDRVYAGSEEEYVVWIGVAMAELQAAPPRNPSFRGAFSFGSPKVGLLEMCLGVLEGIRHEVQRSELT
jgi:hypothetical protein